MFDEETEARIDELTDELYAALVDDRDVRFWEGGIVQVAPTGAPPEYITVEIEGIEDESVMWRGHPGNLSVTDEVLVWENPITHRREIIGSSGTFASSPFVHDHSSLAQGGTHWGGITQTWGGGSGANIITVPDNVADALHIVDDGDGDIYIRIVTTTGSEAVVFNDGEDDVDFRVAASGITNALFMRGSDGYTCLGAAVSENVLLHLQVDDLGALTMPVGNVLLLEQDNNAFMNMVSGTADHVGFRMGDPADTDIGWIAYENNNDAMTFGTNTAEQVRIDSAGNVGIGTTAPQGRLHGFDTIGGFLYWEGDVDGAGEIEIIPNAAGDVERAIFVICIAWANAAADYGSIHTTIVTPGAGNVESTVYVDAVPNELRLRLYSTGQLVVRRHVGADTYDVCLWAIWQ